MASYENFYAGNKYSFDSSYSLTPYGLRTADVAFPSDPLTANQLQAVSKKISTGAKTIEVSGLGLAARSAMAHLAAIPKQHWKEIDRLRKLTGVELTFHGPLIEPTGVGRGNWSEDQRKEVERQAFEAVKLAQQMNPDGNIIVTFHSSNGLPEVRRRIKVGKNPDGTPIEKTVQLSVVNERTGSVGQIPTIQKDYLLKKGKEVDMDEWLSEQNKQQWVKDLDNIAFETNRARREIQEALGTSWHGESEELKKEVGGFAEAFNLARTNPEEFNKKMERLGEIKPEYRQIVERRIVPLLNEATIFLDQSYLRFKDAFGTAYEGAEKANDMETKGRLDKLRDKILPVINNYAKDKGNFEELSEELNKGISVLNTIRPPETFKPLEEFAYEKAGETFGNVAWNSYKKFKERSPIISIENPPVGLTGLTRADEIAKLVKESRKVFVEKAKNEGMSEGEAKKQADKIIGATWDTGHINSIRKWGFDEADVVREAKTIAPFVKHMHIADNLGFEDSELPIGMGNVPIEKLMKIKAFQKIKKTIETGDWFSKQGGLAMSHTPVREAFEGLGANVYSMGAVPDTPYWNQVTGHYGGYFGGLGPINPDVHHTTYGSGFSGLPVELGGEIPGQRSRFSGAPIE